MENLPFEPVSPTYGFLFLIGYFWFWLGFICAAGAYEDIQEEFEGKGYSWRRFGLSISRPIIHGILAPFFIKKRLQKDGEAIRKLFTRPRPEDYY